MDNYTTITKFALENGNQITTSQAHDLLAGNYYHNGAHYVSEILTRMVNAGKLKRIKRGVYEISSGHRKNLDQINNEQQTTLF
jgi:hypothetical protein